MCNICENLVNVPKDKKATLILQDDESELTNLDRTSIEVNHNEKGERYAFITHQLQLKDNRMWSHPIYIKYCPFCGENLKIERRRIQDKRIDGRIKFVWCWKR